MPSMCSTKWPGLFVSSSNQSSCCGPVKQAPSTLNCAAFCGVACRNTRCHQKNKPKLSQKRSRNKKSRRSPQKTIQGLRYDVIVAAEHLQGLRAVGICLDELARVWRREVLLLAERQQVVARLQLDTRHTLLFRSLQQTPNLLVCRQFCGVGAIAKHITSEHLKKQHENITKTMENKQKLIKNLEKTGQNFRKHCIENIEKHWKTCQKRQKNIRKLLKTFRKHAET